MIQDKLDFYDFKQEFHNEIFDLECPCYNCSDYFNEDVMHWNGEFTCERCLLEYHSR